MIRAILFASATITTFIGRRKRRSWIHGSDFRAFVTTLRAPCTSNVRKCVTPRLLIPCKSTFPPDPVCFGTKPAHAANSRPDRKVFASPTIATAAVAVRRPTPGISLIARTARSCFFHSSIRLSIAAICSSSFERLFHCSRKVSIRTAGRRSAKTGENRRRCSIERSSTDRHDFAILGEQSAKTVDLHGSKFHQLRTHAVK